MESEKLIFGLALLLVAVAPAGVYLLMQENDSTFLVASIVCASVASLLALWQISTLVSYGGMNNTAFEWMVPILGLAVVLGLAGIIPQSGTDRPLSVGEGVLVVAIILVSGGFSLFYVNPRNFFVNAW